MAPFAYEVDEDRDAGNRWSRFYWHTSTAAPVRAGVELVVAFRPAGLAVCGLSDSASGLSADGGSVAASAPGRLSWGGWSHVSETLGRSAADNKRAHWVEAMVSRHAPVCPLFVDDEPAVVDEFIARVFPRWVSRSWPDSAI